MIIYKSLHLWYNRERLLDLCDSYFLEVSFIILKAYFKDTIKRKEKNKNGRKQEKGERNSAWTQG